MERDVMMEEIYDKYPNPKDLPSTGECLKEKYESFEAIMDEEGNLYEIPHGHQLGLVCIFADKIGISRYDAAYGTFAKNLSFFFEEMLKEAHIALLHQNQVQSNSLTEKQKEKIKELQKEEIMDEVVFISELNYNGVRNNPKVYHQKRDT